MDERFENPSEDPEEEGAAADEAAEREDGEAPAAPTEQSEQQEATATTEAATGEAADADEDPLNIREDWDSATIYVEPEQSEDIEVTFTRLKKQLKREGITLEKNKHFYRAIFEVTFGEYREETKEKIRELAKKDTDQ